MTPAVEENPETGSVREKIAAGDNPQTPSNLALEPAVAVRVIWVVILGVQSASFVSLLPKNVRRTGRIYLQPDGAAGTGCQYGDSTWIKPKNTFLAFTTL